MVGKQEISIAIDERELHSAMKNADSSTILNLKVGEKENKVVLRDTQRDPVTNKVIHLDFHAISMTRPINIAVPIHFFGEPMGVKVDGGIMQITMRELEISCLPTNIPDHFEVNVDDLGIGDSVHVKDISIPNATIMSEQQRTMVVISAPTVIKVDTTAEEEAELAEGEEALAEGAEGAAAEGAEGAAEGATKKEAPAKPEEKKEKKK